MNLATEDFADGLKRDDDAPMQGVCILDRIVSAYWRQWRESRGRELETREPWEELGSDMDYREHYPPV